MFKKRQESSEVHREHKLGWGGRWGRPERNWGMNIIKIQSMKFSKTKNVKHKIPTIYDFSMSIVYKNQLFFYKLAMTIWKQV